MYPVFHYEEKDFNFVVKVGGESKFDSSLITRWRTAEENGVLRYRLRIKEKRVEGKNKFLAQFNPERSTNRRIPEEINSMKTPFNPAIFNFTKIKKEEIFFDILRGDGDNVVAANVSPLEFGHSLFLPERTKCRPQIATLFSFLKIVELILLSGSPFLRAVFNSLCGHASVNHLHWHLYYLKHKMLLEDIPLDKMADRVDAILDYPARGFCLRLSSFGDWRTFAEAGWRITDFLQAREIAHNVFITRGKFSSLGDDYDDVRMYIWGRKSSTGVKDTTQFIPACSELFGHLLIKNEEIFNNLGEESINSILENVTDIFFSIKNDVVNLIE